MTWREKIICRILLIVAGMLADDSALEKELRFLSNSISQGPPKPELIEAA